MKYHRQGTIKHLSWFLQKPILVGGPIYQTNNYIGGPSTQGLLCWFDSLSITMLINFSSLPIIFMKLVKHVNNINEHILPFLLIEKNKISTLISHFCQFGDCLHKNDY
jgi:hypothetical protein